MDVLEINDRKENNLANRTQLSELTLLTVKQSGIPLRDSSVVFDHVSEASTLFGKDGLYDSLGLVSFLLEIEQEINTRYRAFITIADEKALSQERSPFRTVGSLVDYVVTLLDENGEA